MNSQLPLPEGRRSNAPRSGMQRAFTVIELVVVVVIMVALLTALLLPALSKAKLKAVRIQCTNNLKQVGISERLWSGDHGDKFPIELYANQSGGFKFADATNGFRYFQVLSNELKNPSVLLCPSDTARSPATNFGSGFGNTHVSYFLGPEADESVPGMFLAGDRNITNGTPTKNGILTLTSTNPAGWTMEMHRGIGNVALSDGSVQGFNSAILRQAVRTSGTNEIRLLMP